MIEFSSSLKLNEIHIVDSPFIEDPNFFFQGDPNFGGGTVGKFWGKWAITGTSIVMQIGGWSVSKENISLYPLVPKSL